MRYAARANGSRSPSISATLSGSDGIVTAIFQSPAGSSPRFAGDANTRLSYDALGTWMALPASADWVNLSPDEPDRIVDSEMGKTEVGRILLLADLQMKKDIGKLNDPRASQRAQQFWQEVDKSIPAGTPISFRVWIVPGRVVVNTGGAGTDAYIADAQLDVKLEAQYLRERGGPPSGQSASLPQTDASQQAADTLLTREILPDLVNRVNHADQYAGRRQLVASGSLEPASDASLRGSAPSQCHAPA